MEDQYRLTLYDPAEADTLTGDSDELYWTLDGLTPPDNPTATIESINTTGRFIEVTVHGKQSLTIRYRENDSDGVRQVDDADILAAHQAIMACLSRAHGWRQTLDPISGSFGTADLQVDYQQTGLSIANAMLDEVKRRQRRGLPKPLVPTIIWGSRRITTGDTWHGIPNSGEVTVRTLHLDRAHEHGIAIRAPGGTLTIGSAEPVTEAIIWPTASSTEAVVDYVSPTQMLQVCNVYTIRGATRERVDRWSEKRRHGHRTSGKPRTALSLQPCLDHPTGLR